MKIRTFRYFVKEAVKSMRRNGLMTIASISTVALSLFILGIFTCGVVNLDNLASNLESQVEVSVYLQDNLTTPEIMDVGKKLKVMPGLTKMEFVSKQEALQRFEQRLGDQKDMLQALDGNNPLPNAYVLTFETPEQVKDTAATVTKFKGVDSVHYGQDVVEQIFKITQIIRIGGIILIVFLACATLFIISNTIRLTVFARRKEIAIMKYVGATNGFIRWPFLLEGVILGFIGAAIASACVWEFYLFVTGEVQNSLAFLPIVPIVPFFYKLAGGLFAVGILVGAVGSAISIKQYMKV